MSDNVKNTPTEPGFYWAKSDNDYKWYHLIVNISGESPYLEWVAWDRGPINGKIIKGSGKPDFIFGDKINEPIGEIK